MKKGAILGIIGAIGGVSLIAWFAARVAAKQVVRAWEGRESIDLYWIGGIGANFSASQFKTASVPITTTGLNNQVGTVKVFLGLDENTPVAAGQMSFVDSGGTQNVAVSVLMPATPGTYHVFVDVTIGGVLYPYKATEDVTITAPLPPAPTIAYFFVNPTSIISGQTATLSWSIVAQGMLSVSMDENPPAGGPPTGGGFPPAGSLVVSPTETTTYTLTATNEGGSVTKSVTLTVSQVSVQIGPPVWQ